MHMGNIPFILLKGLMMKTELTCPKCGAIVEKYLNPKPTVDIVIHDRERGLVLVDRKNPPYGNACLLYTSPEPMNEVVTQHLSAFRSLMPVDMELAGASIGNLILTSGYLSLARQLEPVVRVFSGMVQARGVVMPVADSCAHLCVRLENGEVIVGQHRFTGKTATAITSPILDMWLSASLDDPSPVSVPIQPRLAHVIRTADLICYPVGSFFSSVMANLLPVGVSCAVRCLLYTSPVSHGARSNS